MVRAIGFTRPRAQPDPLAIIAAYKKLDDVVNTIASLRLSTAVDLDYYAKNIQPIMRAAARERDLLWNAINREDE